MIISTYVVICDVCKKDLLQSSQPDWVSDDAFIRLREALKRLGWVENRDCNARLVSILCPECSGKREQL